jgi:hypothetical protein
VQLRVRLLLELIELFLLVVVQDLADLDGRQSPP